MKQALHIFRKDVRRLWVPIGIALAFQILFTFFEMRGHQADTPVSITAPSVEMLVGIVLPLAWWYLIAALVHGEALPGERQFWTTRPYNWKSLLGAKVLFVLAFVNLPVAIGDVSILAAQGFPVHWGALLWRQIPFTAWALLPPMALASLTRHLGQVIGAILLVVLRIVVASIPFGSPAPTGLTGMNWIEETVQLTLLLAVLSTVVLIQYRSRRTWLGRTLLAAFVVLPGFSIPLGWQLRWQARVRPPALDTSAVGIRWDPTRTRRTPLQYVRGSKTANLTLPLLVDGLPRDVDLASGGATITVADTAGVLWSSDLVWSSLERDKTGYWQTIVVPARAFEAMRNRPVTLRVDPVITALRGTEVRAPLQTGQTVLPGVGICEPVLVEGRILIVSCRSTQAAAQLRMRVHADYPGWDEDRSAGVPAPFSAEVSDAPFQTGVSLSPVQRWQPFLLAGDALAAARNYVKTQLVYETEQPIAHFQREIEKKDVELENYAVMLPEK